MDKPQDPEAAETVQTTSVPAVDLPQLVRLLAVAQPVMESWAKSHELDEWHCRCEDMIGTAYPRNLCPMCCVESSINWRDGKPYYYCPDHGELDDLYCEPNAQGMARRERRPPCEDGLSPSPSPSCSPLPESPKD